MVVERISSRGTTQNTDKIEILQSDQNLFPFKSRLLFERVFIDQGSVVQSIVSLKSSLIGQLVSILLNYTQIHVH